MALNRWGGTPPPPVDAPQPNPTTGGPVKLSRDNPQRVPETTPVGPPDQGPRGFAKTQGGGPDTPPAKEDLDQPWGSRPVLQKDEEFSLWPSDCFGGVSPPPFFYQCRGGPIHPPPGLVSNPAQRPFQYSHGRGSFAPGFPLRRIFIVYCCGGCGADPLQAFPNRPDVEVIFGVEAPQNYTLS